MDPSFTTTIFFRGTHASALVCRKRDWMVSATVPVLKDSNLRLNEGSPREYFGAMAETARSQGTLGGLRRRLRNSMIPGDPNDSAWADGFSIERLPYARGEAPLCVLPNTGLTPVVPAAENLEAMSSRKCGRLQ